MQENENDLKDSAAKHDETPGPEERQAEEFAGEMHAEPKNIDGEPGLATPEEEAAAAVVESLSADDLNDRAAKHDETPGPEERQAEEFAGEMHAEPKNIDGEPGLATPEEEAAAAAVESLSADDLNARAAKHDETPGPEERQAEEFAGEMHAEPKNIDGEPGLATPEEEAAAAAVESLSADEILAPDAGKEQPKWPAEDAELTAMLEAVIYVTDEPLTLEQISTALEQPRERMKRLLDNLVAEWQKPQHGLSIREVAGGYKMATKPEHHDAVRQFVKSLKAPMKLSLPALETLAVIAYKQPVTAPEIMEIRGVQGAGVLKTLMERKLIASGGRKNVIGKPILYKTTKEFLVQFGLKDLSELPSVKEFEELARFATAEPETPAPVAPVAVEAVAHEPVPAQDVPGEKHEEEPEPEPVAEPVTE